MFSNLYQSYFLLNQAELLLLVIAIMIPAYFMGKFLWPIHSNNAFLLANRLFFGLLFFIWCAAVYVTKGKTLLLPLFILFAYSFFISLTSASKQSIPVSFIVKCLLGFMVIWAANFIIFSPVRQNSIVIVNDDLALYSDFANYMYTTGHEAYQQFYYTHPVSNNLYHFADLWFLGILQNIFHINGYTAYAVIIKSVIAWLLFLYMFGFAGIFGLKSWVKYLVILIPFLIVLPPFLNFNNVPWYFSMYYFVVPFINYNGGFFILTYLLLSMSAFCNEQGLFSIILLSLMGLINPLLIGIAPILLVLIVVWLVLAPKVKFLKNHYLFSSQLKINNVIVGLCFSIAVALYAAWLTRNPESNYVQKYSTSLFAFAAVYIKYILAALIYGLPYMVGLYYLIRHLFNASVRNLIIILFLFFHACGLFYGVFYPKIQGDIFQVQLVSWVICIVFLGIFGLLSMIEYKTKPYLALALLTVITLVSIVGVVDEKSASFFPVYFWNHQNDSHRVAINEVSELKKLVDKIGTNGGYIESNDKARPPEGPIYEYLYFFDSRIRTIRLNVIDNDLMNEQRKQLMSQTYLFNVYGWNTSYNSEQLNRVAKDYNISWIITNKSDTSYMSMLPAFKKKVSFTYFNIYTR